MEFQLTLDKSKEKLIDPIRMLIRKALLTSLERYAVIGVAIKYGDVPCCAMNPISTSTTTPFDIALELSKYNVFLSPDKVKENILNNANNEVTDFLIYECRFNDISTLKVSDFGDIIEPMDSYSDKVIATFNSPISFDIELYISLITGDISRNESNSIIESNINFNVGSSIVCSMPGVLFPGTIVTKSDSSGLGLSVALEVPESFENQISSLISKDIPEIFQTFAST